jgi:hypothetical protein
VRIRTNTSYHYRSRISRTEPSGFNEDAREPGDEAPLEHQDAYPVRGRVVPEIREIGIVDFRELFEKPFRICYRRHGRDAVIVSVLDVRRDLERVLNDRALGR